jgi:hypothetical protein
MPVEAPVPLEHPLMQAWGSFRASPEFEQSSRWALRLAELRSGGVYQTDDGLAPIEQRRFWVHGALWAAFCAGFAAAGGKVDV